MSQLRVAMSKVEFYTKAQQDLFKVWADEVHSKAVELSGFEDPVYLAFAGPSSSSVLPLVSI